MTENELHERIYQLEQRVSLICERLDNHAEQIKFVNEKVMSVAQAVFKYAKGMEEVLKK